MLVLCITGLRSQPDPRFESFDWVVYRNPGHINAFSEGYVYMYIASSEGGIHRYNLFSNRFEEPISMAQGLSTNRMFTVYFDKVTGILWSLTENGVEFSGSRSGDWTLIPWDELGVNYLHSNIRMGSSVHYIWIRIGTTYFKLDHINGIMLGMSAHPDEDGITWSSRRLVQGEGDKDILMDYTILDGWLYDLDRFMNSNGEYEEIVTLYAGDQFQNLWVGTDRGTVLTGSLRSKLLIPHRVGIGNTDVTTILEGNQFWLGGRNKYRGQGITIWDPANNTSDIRPVESSIISNERSVYTGKRIGNRIWFGTDSGVLVYESKERYWTQLDEKDGVPPGTVLSITGDTASVWLGSSRGLTAYHAQDVDSVTEAIVDFFYNRRINDVLLENNLLWVADDYSLILADLSNELTFAFDSNDFLAGKNGSMVTRFWQIGTFDDAIYVGTMNGIFRYEPAGNKWNLVIDPALYKNSRISDLKFYGHYCFIGKDDGLTIVDMQRNWFRNYDYPFVGRIFTMVPEEEIIWLGTDRGLIKFLWNKDAP